MPGPVPNPPPERARATAMFRTPRMAVLRAKSTDPQRIKLDRLVHFARGHRKALVLTHDNPDPDSLASAVALAYILERSAGVPAVVRSCKRTRISRASSRFILASALLSRPWTWG